MLSNNLPPVVGLKRAINSAICSKCVTVNHQDIVITSGAMGSA
ncbi:hypothetical protein O9992_16835 [Vibrio lentus]|nr:hypothetical protein [Vibrio lentus]